MNQKTHIDQPLISVIIPSFNHAHFLPDAINSVQNQSYKNTEIVVVDDGSTDNAKEVLINFPDVKYVYQSNQGLSAARNTGIKNSNGKYLVFLDADDILFPEALTINNKYLQQNPSWAFVSGWYEKIDAHKSFLGRDTQVEIKDPHYNHMLRGNYIGMIATVLYQRWVFDEFQYDTSLKACEDYDLYLKVTRKYPVSCHDQNIAGYRFHGNNMSARIPFMLEHALLALKKQEKFLLNEEERKAYLEGIQIWNEYYLTELHLTLRANFWKSLSWPNREELTLLSRRPKWFIRFCLSKIKQNLIAKLTGKLPVWCF